MDDTKKGMQRIADLGPTGDTVRAQVTAFRERQHLTYAELSRRLESVGRPISTLALRRIEAGARRVDSDDLVALALVLGATPNSLLMNPEEGVDEPLSMVRMTALGELPGPMCWDWLTGECPVYDEAEGELVFSHRNQPPGWKSGSGSATEFGDIHAGDLEQRIARMESMMAALTKKKVVKAAQGARNSSRRGGESRRGTDDGDDRGV